MSNERQPDDKDTDKSLGRKRRSNNLLSQPLNKRRKLNFSIGHLSIKFHPITEDHSSRIPFTIHNPSTFAIGSDPSCLVISSHPAVSPIHAHVSYNIASAMLSIKALDSGKTVFVNEYPISDLQFSLKHGDKIRIGKTLKCNQGFTNEYRLEMIENTTNQTNPKQTLKQPQWPCAVCTLLNDDLCDACAVCGHTRDNQNHNHNTTQQHDTTANTTPNTATNHKVQNITNPNGNTNAHSSTNMNPNDDTQNAFIWSWHNGDCYQPYSDRICQSLNDLHIDHAFVFTVHSSTYEIKKITPTECEQRNLSTNYKRHVKRTVSSTIESHMNQLNIISPFMAHMSIFEASGLKPGHRLDYRDTVGHCFKAQVIAKNESSLQIHYVGYDDAFDITSDYKTNIHCFATADSITARPAHRLTHFNIGDCVDVNPVCSTHIRTGWKYGRITTIEGGQVEVAYLVGRQQFKYWVHLDNVNEIAEPHAFTPHSVREPQRRDPLDPRKDVTAPFAPHMKYHELHTLDVGSFVDLRDKYGQWFVATVIRKQQFKLTVHYCGWSSDYDETVDYRYEWVRFGKHGSVSSRDCTRFEALTVGDFVDANPMSSHPGWRIAEIKSKKGGQIQVEYVQNNKTYLHWVHGDDTEEVAPFMERAGGERKIDVESLFFESLRRSDYDITEVQSVSDSETVYEAILNKKLSEQHKKRRESVEQYLWHGTRNVKNLEYILKNGFDRSFNSTSKFGKGTYFAKHASYSVRQGFCGRDSENVSYIVLCKVIVGDYTIGTSNMSTIAKKTDGSEYDSLVNTLDDPTVFVVWRDYHAVPYRVVKFVMK